MQADPKSWVLVQLCSSRYRICGNLCLQDAPVACAFCRRGTSVHNRLHNSLRQENHGWAKREYVCSGATLRFIRFCHRTATRFELTNVMLKTTGRDWNHARHVVRGRARSGFDISKMRGGVWLWSKSEKKDVIPTQRFQPGCELRQFTLEILGVSLNRGEALYLSEKILA